MVAFAATFLLVGCPDELPSVPSDDGESDEESGDEEGTMGTTPTTVTASGSASSSTTTPGTETSATETSGTTMIDDTTTTSESDTDTTSTTGTSGSSSSSSSGLPDEDVQCEGPEGDDTCDTPSPYDGEGDCDPYAQDCDAGERCVPWANDGGGSWNATRCSPLDDDPDGLGDACTVEGSGVSGVDSCDIGLMCLGVDPETNIGTCSELCGCGPDEPTCSGGGTICSITNGGALPICLPACDPLGYDGTEDICEDGQVCVPVGAWFLCAPDGSGDDGAAGDDCSSLNGCDPGLMCVASALIPGCGGLAAGCCTEFCDTGEGDSGCSNNQTECVAFFEAGQEPEECHEDTGVCIDPDA